MKKWRILNKEDSKKEKVKSEEVLGILLKNRDIKPSEVDEFLKPSIKNVSLKTTGIDSAEFTKFKKRILKAIEGSEKIIVYGDYDVDGITGTAILWETLYAKYKNVFPYIPDRVDEGYGLSKKGIDNLLLQYPDTKIIITVDNGIVAVDAVSYATEKGIDVIITDHHTRGKKDPESYATLHTTSLCGAGVAWVLAKELGFEDENTIHEKLELACLATIADLVPLKGANRAIVVEGLKILKKTKRLGLKELFVESQIDADTISTYTIGHVICPRINASGRISKAITALRLLCSKNPVKAKEYAKELCDINRDRQFLTEEAVNHAKLLAVQQSVGDKVMVVAHESYKQGVIGLVASYLVESYYRPSVAISIGEVVSKGSARSITGVNVIELLRSVSHTLVEVGGHPMAAGFSIETHRIDEFRQAISERAEEIITTENLERFLTIDMALPFEIISQELFKNIQLLSPFGMANPEPVFATSGVEILECRKIGKEGTHLKLQVSQNGKVFNAVGFGLANKCQVNNGDTASIAYTIDENTWNGRTSLQLKIRDIKVN